MNQQFIKQQQYRCILFLLLLPQFAFAGLGGTWADAVTIVVNISQNVSALTKFVTGFLYLAGIGFGVKAIFALKVYGEQRTMMASNTSLKPTLTWLMVSCVFLFLPGVIDTTMNSVFGDSSVLTYADWEKASSDVYFEQLMEGIFMIVKLVGLISFARGWFIISASAHQGGGGQNTVGKGVIHILGGLMGMNIVKTINILDNTLNG